MKSEADAKSEAGRALVAHRRLYAKVCEQCGISFRARVEARYCSDRCRYRAAYLRRGNR